MYTMTSEKKRAKNFNKDDVELLTALVFKYKSIIENKKTDGVTVKQKNEAWSKLAEEFSASASHPRTAEQLKTYYKNTKSNIKKELSKEKAELFKTGGGCSLIRSDRDNPLYEIVQAEITPLSNPYDSSNSYYNDEPLPSTSRGNSQANYENSFQEFLELDRARKIGTFDDDTSDDDDDDDNDGPATSANLVDIEPVSSAGAIGVVPSSVHAPTTPTPTVGVTAGAAGVAAGAAGAAAGAVGLSSVHAPTTPTPNVIRNTKRKRINFNTLREYVGEMGELKKRKYELQNKLLELTIKKLEKELNTPNE